MTEQLQIMLSLKICPKILLTLFTGHMFNTGLPPLDRHGLFPSHGSILDPLQTPSYPKSDSFRPKEKPPEQPAAPPPPISNPKPVQTVNLESDEEVLVDDFDGQCCRTYPDNHSRILKWRAQKAEKAKTAAVINKPSAVAVVTTASVASSTTIVKSLSTSSLVTKKPQDLGAKPKDGGPPTTGKDSTITIKC